MNSERRKPIVPKVGSWRDQHRDTLAQRYAMGLLAEGAERSFEAWLSQDARLQANVREWQAVLAQLSMHTPMLEPSTKLWARIEGELGPAPAPPQPVNIVSRLLSFASRVLDSTAVRMGGAAAAGAIACAVVLLAPSAEQGNAQDASMPASYVGVLTDSGDQARLVVASLRYSRQVQLKLVKPLEVPTGSSAVLWGLKDGSPPQAITRLPSSTSTRVTVNLDVAAEKAFSGFSRLAVSVEPTGRQLSDGPSKPYLLKGHCAKVW